MTNLRRDYMRKTYDEIRSITLSLTCSHRRRLPSLPQEINADLARAPIEFDLLKPLSEDAHKSLSPGEVLERVRQTITRAQSTSQAPPFVRHPTESTTHPRAPSSLHSERPTSIQNQLTENSRTARTAEGGDALVDVVQEMYRACITSWKRRTERRASSRNPHREQSSPEDAELAPLTPQEINSACASLVHRLDNFRTTYLRPLKINDFSVLRAEHVLPTRTSSGYVF
jgi:hypothetical protein